MTLAHEWDHVKMPLPQLPEPVATRQIKTAARLRQIAARLGECDPPSYSVVRAHAEIIELADDLEARAAL